MTDDMLDMLTLAERITHMSQRFTFTALKSARLRGEPYNIQR